MAKQALAGLKIGWATAARQKKNQIQMFKEKNQIFHFLASHDRLPDIVIKVPLAEFA